MYLSDHNKIIIEQIDDVYEGTYKSIYENILLSI